MQKTNRPKTVLITGVSEEEWVAIDALTSMLQISLGEFFGLSAKQQWSQEIEAMRQAKNRIDQIKQAG